MLRCMASRWVLLGALALTAICLLPACGGRAKATAPKGKARVELQVSPLTASVKGAAAPALAKADIDRTLQVLQARVEGYGLPAPQAQFQPPDRIVLEVATAQPGEIPPRDLETLLTTRGLLEVRAIPTEYAKGGDKTPVEGTTTGIAYVFRDAAGKQVPASRALAGAKLLASSRDFAPNAKARMEDRYPFVFFELREPARTRFREFTRTHVDTWLAFVLDGDVLACPIIRSEVDKGAIQPPPRPDSAAFPELLAIMMNSGPLPLTVHWLNATPMPEN
jgi:preprotein translocase subunit SecD